MKIRGTTITTPFARYVVTDDTGVSASPWSSQNTLDKMCIGFEETGKLVTCEGVEGYPLEVVSEIPYQGGSRLKNLTVTRLGKNFIGFEDYSGVTATNRTMSCTDGVHKAEIHKNLKTSFILVNPSDYQKNGYLVPGTYVFSIDQKTNGSIFTGCYAKVTLEDGTTVKLPDGQAVTLTQAGRVSSYHCSNNSSLAAGTEINFTLQVEKGSVATEYEPYTKDIYTVDFSEYNIFNATYNWKTGVLNHRSTGGVSLTSIQLTPQEIPTNSGENTFISSAEIATGTVIGETIVKGKKDPVKVIKTLEDELFATNEKLTKLESELEKVVSEGVSVSRLINVNIPASAWVTESTGLHSQTVKIAGTTEYSKVDLLPSVEQLAIFHSKDVAFVTENENGVITVYAIGDKPAQDYTMQAQITEVRV